MSDVRLGNHAWLMLGDCLERMAEIPDGSVDMVLCDLPYGTTACKWDAVIPFEPLWAQYRRITKPGAAIVLTASQPFTTSLIQSNRDMFRYCWVWVKNRKTGAMAAKMRPMVGHEDVAVFYAKAPTYNRQLTPRDKPITAKTPATRSEVYALSDGVDQGAYRRRTDTICPDTVIHFATERGHHPTQKPVALMDYMIRTYTNEGETVLDNTMGSGTTGVAAINTGRQFIGIERDPAYFATAAERITAASPSSERKIALMESLL